MKRWLWPMLKLLLAAAILVGVGRQFYYDLSSETLDDLAWRPEWLVASAACYLVFLSTSGWYWRRLLRHIGPAPSWWNVYRAYFVSQLGKYVPGKALALVIRGMLVQRDGVPLGLAILTSLYEVLTTMAAGAMVAALIFAIEPPRVLDLNIHPAWAGLLLLGICGVPLLPMFFNALVRRMARKVPGAEPQDVPPLATVTLLQGLAVTGCGWMLLGVAIWCALNAVLADPLPFSLELWLQCTGIVGLAYVGGFLAVFMPGGVGVREYVLLKMLAFAGPSGLVAAAVLLMRLAWTIGELTLAAFLYLSRLKGGRIASP